MAEILSVDLQLKLTSCWCLTSESFRLTCTVQAVPKTQTYLFKHRAQQFWERKQSIVLLHKYSPWLQFIGVPCTVLRFLSKQHCPVTAYKYALCVYNMQMCNKQKLKEHNVFCKVLDHINKPNGWTQFLKKIHIPMFLQTIKVITQNSCICIFPFKSTATSVMCSTNCPAIWVLNDVSTEQSHYKL